MKALFSTLVLLIFFISNSQAQDDDYSWFKLDMNKKYNEEKVNTAKELAVKLVAGMKNNNYYLLKHSEASKEFISTFDFNRQKEFYNNVSAIMGEFQGDIKIKEIYKFKSSSATFDIYRFECKFSNLSSSEIRMYFDQNDKLIKFMITPWLDKIYSSQI